MGIETPILNASTTKLAAAVEENLFALFQAMAEVLPNSELLRTENLSRHLSFPYNPMFKGVWRTRIASDDLAEMIDETIAWFKARKAPFFFWWTGPSTEPVDLGKQLTQRGLISMEEQQKQFAHGIVQTHAGAPGMVADLYQVNEDILKQVPPGCTIEEIQDKTSLDDFKKVFVEAYGVPEWAGQAWVDAALSVGIGKTPWKMYLGRLNGEPVATNMLFNGGGVASVYGVATLPSVRRKGIGAAITLKPLLEARSSGYPYAVLFSSEMGIHAYERIGFHLTDCRINRYLWQNV